jgi:hypothetical protein
MRLRKSVFVLLLLAAFPGTAITNSCHAKAPEENLELQPLSPDQPQKITIGEVEDVMLLPWTVTLPARIDTGATLSSLDARDLSVRNNIAHFVLGKRYGSVRLRLPVVDWIFIRSSTGTEKRPVVEIPICLGSKIIRALATLKDRSQMTYPFSVGRNALSGGFMIDTSRSRAAQPRCQSSALSTGKALDPATPE